MEVIAAASSEDWGIGAVFDTKRRKQSIKSIALQIARAAALPAGCPWKTQSGQWMRPKFQLVKGADAPQKKRLLRFKNLQIRQRVHRAFRRWGGLAKAPRIFAEIADDASEIRS